MLKNAKKKILLATALCSVAVFGAGLALAAPEANADGQAMNITMTEGASVRFGAKEGIRFSATVENLEAGAKVGCLVAKSEDVPAGDLLDHTDTYVSDAKNAKPVEGTNTYNYAFYNIPVADYYTEIVARAYVQLADGTYVYAADQQTRSVAGVANDTLNDPTVISSLTSANVKTLQKYTDTCPKSGKHLWGEGVLEGNKKTYTCSKCENVRADKVAAWATGDGVLMDKNDKIYRTKVPYDKMPYTYEFSIQVSALSRRAVIFGNNAEHKNIPYVQVSVNSSGSPEFTVNGNQAVFGDVDVRSDEFVHVALCMDVKNNQGLCYVNGELKQTLEGVSLSELLTENVHYIGSDMRSGNPYAFKGKIRSLAMYGDVRSAAEVVEDMVAINPCDKDLVAAYDFNVAPENGILQDLGYRDYDLRVENAWNDSVEPVGEFDYSFAVVGDTQSLLDNYPDKMTTLYKWLVDNKEAEKIAYVMGLGDIVEHLYYSEGNLAREWKIARDAIYQMNGKVPYSLVRGNHDDSALFNQTFANDEYLSTIDGAYGAGVINTYRTLRAGDYQYLIMTLDYTPSDDVIAWADSVVEAYPDHRVIVTTHSYIHRDLGYDAPGNGSEGQKIWDNFISKHENIMMVLCGHNVADKILVKENTGANGNVVKEIMIDPQDMDLHNTPSGMVVMFYFSPDGKTVKLREYSTVREQYSFIDSQITLDFSGYEEIGKNKADTMKPRVVANNPQMGVANVKYTLPEIFVTDDSGEKITPTYTVYKKGDANKTAISVTDNAFTPTEGGLYILAVTAQDSAGNTTEKEFELPIRNTALKAGVLEDFDSEASFVNFKGGAQAEWLASHDGATGVLHLKPNDTSKSFYYFRLFAEDAKTDIEFNSVTLRVWVDAGGTNSTSFYDTYEGTWKGVPNSNSKGWQTVKLSDFYNWTYFSENAKSSTGAQLFWTWTANTHIYIDEITYDAEKSPIVELDKEEYAIGDQAIVKAYLAEDKGMPVEISVIGPDGNPVTVTDGKFTMEAKGTYVLTAQYGSGYYAGSTTLEIEAIATTIRLNGEVEECYRKGGEITIPTASVFDYTGIDYSAVEVEAKVTFKGDDVTLLGGKFTPNVSGIYYVVYTATLPDESLLEKRVPLIVNDNFLNFTESEADCFVNGTYYEEFQGAYGVMKLTSGALTIKTTHTVEEMQAIEWDRIQFRVWAEAPVGQTEPDPVVEGWWANGSSYGIPVGRWSTLSISKEDFVEKVCTVDEFNAAITSAEGIALTTFWNMENAALYFDDMCFLKNPKFTGVENFDDEASKAIFVTGSETEYLAEYEGKYGVIKSKYTDSWHGVKFGFTEVAIPTDLEWNTFEFTLGADFTGSFKKWDGFADGGDGWSVRGGETETWRTFSISKESLIEKYGDLDAFFATLCGGERLFTLWNFANFGNIYIDCVRVYKATANADGMSSPADTVVFGSEDVYHDGRMARSISVTAGEEVYIKELTAEDRATYQYVEFDFWAGEGSSIVWRAHCIQGEEHHTGNCNGNQSHTVTGGVGTQVQGVYNTIKVWFNGSQSQYSTLRQGWNRVRFEIAHMRAIGFRNFKSDEAFTYYVANIEFVK